MWIEGARGRDGAGGRLGSTVPTAAVSAIIKGLKIAAP